MRVKRARPGQFALEDARQGARDAVELPHDATCQGRGSVLEVPRGERLLARRTVAHVRARPQQSYVRELPHWSLQCSAGNKAHDGARRRGTDTQRSGDYTRQLPGVEHAAAAAGCRNPATWAPWLLASATAATATSGTCRRSPVRTRFAVPTTSIAPPATTRTVRSGNLAEDLCLSCHNETPPMAWHSFHARHGRGLHGLPQSASRAPVPQVVGISHTTCRGPSDCRWPSKSRMPATSATRRSSPTPCLPTIRSRKARWSAPTATTRTGRGKGT